MKVFSYVINEFQRFKNEGHTSPMASGNLARRRSCSRASSQEEAVHLSQKDPDPSLLRGRRPRLRRAGPRSPSHDRETGTARRQSGNGEKQRPRRLGPGDNRVPGQQGGSRSREGKKIKREAGRNIGLQQRSKPCSYKEKTCTSRVEANPAAPELRARIPTEGDGNGET